MLVCYLNYKHRVNNVVNLNIVLEYSGANDSYEPVHNATSTVLVILTSTMKDIYHIILMFVDV
jgi:hypothetical protein